MTSGTLPMQSASCLCFQAELMMLRCDCTSHTARTLWYAAPRVRHCFLLLPRETAKMLASNQIPAHWFFLVGYDRPYVVWQHYSSAHLEYALRFYVVPFQSLYPSLTLPSFTSAPQPHKAACRDALCANHCRRCVSQGQFSWWPSQPYPSFLTKDACCL